MQTLGGACSCVGLQATLTICPEKLVDCTDKHERAHESHDKLPEAKQGPNLRKLEQLDFKYTTSVDQVARE